MQKVVTNVEAYIAQFSDQHQKMLNELRSIIQKSAPGAQEVISYHMPAYKYHGMLLYFAAHTHHIGLYPTASGVKHFEKELSGYTTSKGAIQFSLDKKLPVTLIKNIIKFKVKENVEKEALKKLKKKKNG